MYRITATVALFALVILLLQCNVNQCILTFSSQTDNDIRNSDAVENAHSNEITVLNIDLSDLESAFSPGLIPAQPIAENGLQLFSCDSKTGNAAMHFNH